MDVCIFSSARRSRVPMAFLDAVCASLEGLGTSRDAPRMPISRVDFDYDHKEDTMVVTVTYARADGRVRTWVQRVTAELAVTDHPRGVSTQLALALLRAMEADVE